MYALLAVIAGLALLKLGVKAGTLQRALLVPDIGGCGVQAYECMDALMFNLRQEHVVICDFKSTFHQASSSTSLCTSGIIMPLLGWHLD